MMMLLLLTSVLGYELKKPPSVRAFLSWHSQRSPARSATLRLAVYRICSALICCVLSTLLWARIAAKFANKAEPATLNRATGVVLVVLGAAILANYL